jgi:gelsolin
MLYNEEIDEYCKKLREKSDAFLANCGKHPLEVFRIENFEPVPVDEKHRGKFYNGDSYVVLKQNERDYDIHYWDGEKASDDEIGCSAAFSVELSEVLKKPSRHHLEL